MLELVSGGWFEVNSDFKYVWQEINFIAIGFNKACSSTIDKLRGTSEAFLLDRFANVEFDLLKLLLPKVNPGDEGLFKLTLTNFLEFCLWNETGGEEDPGLGGVALIVCEFFLGPLREAPFVENLNIAKLSTQSFDIIKPKFKIIIECETDTFFKFIN